MKLTTEQFEGLLDGHCQRVVDNMDMNTLLAYAYDSIRNSFVDSTGNRDRYTESALVADILNHECGDEDSAYEFMVGAGVPKDVVDELISLETQSVEV